MHININIIRKSISYKRIYFRALIYLIWSQMLSNIKAFLRNRQFKTPFNLLGKKKKTEFLMQCRSTSTFRSYLQPFQTEMQVSECKKLSMGIFHHSLQPCWRYFRDSQIDASTYRAMKFLLHQSTAASTWWCGPGPRLGWVEMAVGLPKGSRYPGHSLSFFRFAAH